MFNDITPTIAGQIPEHLRTDSPLFVEFVSTYYAYASQRNKSVGIVQNYATDSDIDYCNEEYIVNFYNTYGKHIPSQLAYDRRNFVKLLNSIYNAKGTEKALVLIFQAVFGESVEVTYPSDAMLKASDGIWVREKFITLKTEYGSIPAGNNVFFSFTNLYGDYSFESSNIEELDSTTHRIRFRSYYDLTFLDNQPVYHYDNFGTLLFVGKLVYSPSRLVISNPGRDWVKGQAIVIPGTVRNTVAKVLSTNSNGGITALEILEYGHFHTPGQVVTVSPFRTKPVSIESSVVSTMVSFSPLAYNHVLTLHDHVDSVDEMITGTHTIFELGDFLFSQTNKASLPIENADIIGVTQQEWFDSRSVFVVEYDRVVTTKGYYENSRGQISNQNIKMQDNYFYQAYSYLLETARDVREYKDLLNITHPAGLKRFSKLSKATDFLMTVDVSRTMSIDTLYLLSVYTAADSLYRDISKVLADEITTPELDILDFTKILSDLQGLSELYANHLKKVITDTYLVSDVKEFFDVTKIITETVLTPESWIFSSIKILSDYVNALDTTSLVPIKYFTDTVSVDHLVSTSTVVIQYAAEDYFAEKYVPYSYQLTIG